MSRHRGLGWGLVLLLLFGIATGWLAGREDKTPPEPEADAAVRWPASAASAMPATEVNAAAKPAVAASRIVASASPSLAELEAKYCSKGRSLWELGRQWAASLAASDPHAHRQLEAPVLAQRESAERLLQASLAPLLERLRLLGSERSLALADALSLIVEPDEAIEQRLLAEGLQTRDPVVLLLASGRHCGAKAQCARPPLSRWSELEPDNAAAWLHSELRGDALVQRLASAPRFSTHRDSVRQLLNQAQPASAASAGPLHLEVFLIGVEAAWRSTNVLHLSRHCKAVAPGSAEAQRCASVLEQLWHGTSENLLDSLMVANMAKNLPAGLGSTPAWTARQAWVQSLMRLESDWASKLELDPLTAGCEASTPERELLAAVRREGRVAMLQRLLSERQSAAAALRP